MTLDELICVVSEAYPDDLVRLSHEGTAVGDGLAAFIASELKATYDEDASTDYQLYEAIRVLKIASKELNTVIESLESRKK